MVALVEPLVRRLEVGDGLAVEGTPFVAPSEGGGHRTAHGEQDQAGDQEPDMPEAGRA